MEDLPKGQEFDPNLLYSLEEKLLEKLEMVATALQQTLANKAETKKALKHLEKMIKNLYEFLFAQKQENEIDALISKKPLGGNSCASCDKKLMYLMGIREQYHPWNMLPKREKLPLANVGVGFSRLLQSMRMETSRDMSPKRMNKQDEAGDQPIESAEQERPSTALPKLL